MGIKNFEKDLEMIRQIEIRNAVQKGVSEEEIKKINEACEVLSHYWPGKR